MADHLTPSFFNLYAKDAAHDWAEMEAKHVRALSELEGYRLLVHASFDRIVALETELAKSQSTLRAVTTRLRQAMGLESWSGDPTDENAPS